MFIDIDELTQCVRSPLQLKRVWPGFQERALGHFQLVDKILCLDNVSLVFELKGNKKLLESLKVNLKDIKIKLVYLIDAYAQSAINTRTGNFPLEFTNFAQDFLAQLKLERAYLIDFLQPHSTDKG